MKIGSKTKAPKVEVIDDSEERLQEKAEKIEERLTRLAGELAEAEARVRKQDSLTDEAIRRRADSFMELLNRHMWEVEQRVLYQIIGFIGSAPFWEIKKIQETEHQRKDASATFSKALREGWRYVGYYHNPASTVPQERYTLMIRPKGGPLTDSDYLKFYENYQERVRKENEAMKPTKTLSKPKATAPTVSLKIKPKGSK